MNRERYQLVFSRARGCLVAVGEGARRMGKQGSGQGRPARASLVQTTFASFAFAAALLGASPIQAQLVADPAAPGGQRATVLAAPNGVPLVNITTPSAAGVSRNTWRQFDVGAPGAILNNSRSDVTTQLGGWVQGNPWLAAGSARVILNEVNSVHPSQLKGWVEVAGPRAEVVIANPAGIQVNGAGFINASGVTLTTGAPVFNAGALEAYRVQGGQVTIEGSGLDARGADATAVLARAVQVNAGLWAQRLTMVTGANTVAASGPAVPAAATPAVGDVPAFALDVAQIGGMYAGHIHLVGTEAGLGVNNRGLIAADAGHLTLAVNGQLTNHGAILAAGDMALRAAQLLNEGTAQAPAVIGAGDALALEALHITNRGTLQAHSLHARADTLHNRSGGVLMADRIAIEANEISNRPDTNAALAQAGAPVIAAHDDLQFGVHTLNNEDGALLYSGGNTGIGGSLDADGKAIGQAHSVNNLSATIEAMGELTLAARTLTNERRNVEVTQTTVIDRSPQLSMPAWWVNGKNEHNAPIASTSNHTPYRYYLLDPASILSEELLITPDGNRIRRVEVALEPSDSIHYAASGAYGGQYGVQRRLTVGSPTTAVLYVQERRDGVANPDQVNGAPDVFAAHTREVHTWQQDTLSYSSTWGRCTTNCTLLVVQPGYSDPMADLLRSDQTYLMPTHPGLELSRSAHHTALQDRLNTDAGAPAALRAGAGMQLHIGESLTNRHADILAGGALDVIAPEATVHNEGHTLKRTHHFAITSHTAGLGDFEWTKPEITETLGELGGRITSAGHLNIQALDLTNADHARASGLASNGLAFVGVSLPGEGAPLVVSPNSLLRPAPPNHNVLFETDPRFTQHRSWLGSDYLLDQLAHNPDTTLKRLGDGWQEQKLVREQVAELTGRRYLAGHGSDEAQFRALMDAGLAHAQALELKPGIALSAEQVAQLTTDLVWLVEREVVMPDGQRTTALVPQVYLRQVPSGELQSSGALIAGQQAVLDIGRDLTNTGARIEGDVLLAQAGRDLTNIGGLLQARSELLASAGRHVTIASPTHTTRFTGAHAQQSRTELAGVGAVRVHITKAFGQQAVPIAARYADGKAVDLRRQGNEEEASKWDEGGVYRAALHAGIGLLTGGLAGAAGAGTGALLIDDLGEGIATLNLPEPVRQGLTQVAGTVLGAATGGSAGAAASLNQTAHNHLSRSPYARVRRTVSQENARLTQACGTTCTAEDFRRIDQQMTRLEAAGNLAEIARHSGLTPQQGQQLAQLALELAPIYGTGESLVQLLSGRGSVTGEEVSRFWAAVGVVPVAGGVLRRVGEPAVDALVAIFRGGETSKALADASDVARAPSAAQGDQLRTELGSLSQYAVDHSRDAEYLARTDRNLLQQHNFDMDHVLAGEINAAGKATGYHAEFAADGAARIKPGATVTHNANGTYEAPVQVFDASKGEWVDKVRESTFFPPSWSQARIEYEITEAFKQGTPGTSFDELSPSGLRIQFHWDAKNQRTTFHPIGGAKK